LDHRRLLRVVVDVVPAGEVKRRRIVLVVAAVRERREARAAGRRPLAVVRIAPEFPRGREAPVHPPARRPLARSHLVRFASEWKNGGRVGESPPPIRPPPLPNIVASAMGNGALVARERREFLTGVGGFSRRSCGYGGGEEGFGTELSSPTWLNRGQVSRAAEKLFRAGPPIQALAYADFGLNP
jgi:hypothetical protein